MNEKFIRLLTVHDILTFQEFAECVQGEVTVTKGQFEVNGKSLLGLMSLEVSDGIKVRYPARAIEFEEYLSLLEIK